MKNSTLYSTFLAICLLWFCVSLTDMAVIPPKAGVPKAGVPKAEAPKDEVVIDVPALPKKEELLKKVVESKEGVINAPAVIKAPNAPDAKHMKQPAARQADWGKLKEMAKKDTNLKVPNIQGEERKDKVPAGQTDWKKLKEKPKKDTIPNSPGGERMKEGAGEKPNPKKLGEMSKKDTVLNSPGGERMKVGAGAKPDPKKLGNVSKKNDTIVKLPNIPAKGHMNNGAAGEPDSKKQEKLPHGEKEEESEEENGDENGDDRENDEHEDDSEERDDDREEDREAGEDDNRDDSSSAYESFEDKDDEKLKFQAEPPEHWDGVRLERNGKINADVEQELFLGPDHDDFESIPEEVGKEKLLEIFKLVDTNGDARLSMQELIKWITLKTDEHFKEAAEASKDVFPKVDTNSDGQLTWDEYTIQFLKQRGYNKNKIEKFKQGKNILQEHDEEDNAIYHDRWQTADENDNEALDQDEFISFMHPEHSARMLDIIVEEILHELDQNGDKKLTLAEFVSVPLSREQDLQNMEKEDEWIRGRREEYETRIDLNRDGVATFKELKAYMNPKNKQHAEGEARHLMGVADENQDGLLSSEEVLGNYVAFIGSKVYNYARNVHDEF